MTGQLSKAITALLAGELPSLFGGATPVIKASVAPDTFAIDPASLDSQASEAREDDGADNLAFNPAQAQGPYTLSKPPLPGPIRMWLITTDGDLLALAPAEIVFDPNDPRKFTLRLNPQRQIANVKTVRVAYTIVAVFAKINYSHELAVLLQNSDPAALDKGEDMALAVLALNRPRLLSAAVQTLQEGAYAARIEVKKLQFVRGDSPAPDSRRIFIHAEMGIKVTRALPADQGKPITHIRTVPGVGNPKKPIDIRVDVEA